MKLWGPKNNKTSVYLYAVIAIFIWIKLLSQSSWQKPNQTRSSITKQKLSHYNFYLWMPVNTAEQRLAQRQWRHHRQQAAVLIKKCSHEHVYLRFWCFWREILRCPEKPRAHREPDAQPPLLFLYRLLLQESNLWKCHLTPGRTSYMFAFVLPLWD